MASVVIIKNIFRSAMVFSEMQFYQFNQMFICIFSYDWSEKSYSILCYDVK